MNSLLDFIVRERERYTDRDNNRFAFSLGQAARYYGFLQIVYSRYVDANVRFIDNSKHMRAALVKQSDGTSGPERHALYVEGRDVAELLHLDYESFYLFGTIFVDRIACFIEGYFGAPRQGRIDKHRSLKNKLIAYADEKRLVLPDGFADSVAFLEDSLAEFRDKVITHDKSWRSMPMTVWTPEGEARLGKTKLYPTEGDKQVEGKEPKELLEAIDRYIEQLVYLIETNRSRTQFRLKA